jgi:hypothetical protein
VLVLATAAARGAQGAYRLNHTGWDSAAPQLRIGVKAICNRKSKFLNINQRRAAARQRRTLPQAVNHERVKTMTTDDHDQYDHERMIRIGKAIADTAGVSRGLEQSAQDDPAYRELIQLCRRWWACWHAMGLLSAAGMSDIGAEAYAFDGMKDAAAVLEADIIKTGHADEFFALARARFGQTNGSGFEPEGIRFNELWDEYYTEACDDVET